MRKDSQRWEKSWVKSRCSSRRFRKSSSYSEPSTAIKIFIAFPPSRFRQRRAIDNQADQVVATDYA
jgi:hypothetical protein